VGAAAFPAADHKVAFGDEVRSSGEAEVGERFAKGDHEGPHVVATAAQRILEQYVGCGKLVHDLEVPRIAPELLEPAADDGLVLLFPGLDA